MVCLTFIQASYTFSSPLCRRNIFVIPNTTSVTRSVDPGNKKFQFVQQSASNPYDRAEFESEPDSDSDDDGANLQPQDRHSTFFAGNQAQTCHSGKPQSIGNPAALDPFGAFAIKASHKDEVLVHNCAY
jgi:hypothetical protein